MVGASTSHLGSAAPATSAKPLGTHLSFGQSSSFEGYLLRGGFSESSLRGFEAQQPGDRHGVEAVMNHLHLDGIQHIGCADISSDKLVLLGNTLKEIHEAKLVWRFPERP